MLPSPRKKIEASPENVSNDDILGHLLPFLMKNLGAPEFIA